MKQPEVVSTTTKTPKRSVSDTSDKSDRQTDSIITKQPTSSHALPQLTYSQVAIAERKSLLKTWLASVIGTAVAFALVSGIKDIKALVTTSVKC